MNTRHPVNPALKEEGGARTAHGLQGRSCDACVSSLAGSSPENPGKRDGRPGTVEGRKWASWRQSTQVAAEPGEDDLVRRGPGGETPGGGSLPLTPPQKVPITWENKIMVLEAESLVLVLPLDSSIS